MQTIEIPNSIGNSGVITVDLDGEKRKLRFSMLCLQIFGETCGEDDITKLQPHFDNLRKSMRSMGNLLYAAAKANCEIEGTAADFTPAHCVEWVGLMSPLQLNEVFECFSKSKYIKNVMGAL